MQAIPELCVVRRISSGGVSLHALRTPGRDELNLARAFERKRHCVMNPGDRLGPYVIEAPINSGGMGAVYRARDTRLDRTVAIKVIEGRFSERFSREAKTIASLNHPHVCTLFDVGENYLVMEHIDGVPLKGPLPVAEVIRLGAQIAEALDAAHRKGITHRDLKPGNVLICKSGVKIIDFGLAKAGPVVRGSTEVTLTSPITGEGTILGTVPYMSPEQLQGHEADARSDIFALGCVLYEMLTGKRAFDGKSQVSIMAAILEHEPAPLADVAPTTPAWLDRVIRRCLRKDAEERWQSARDVAIELREPPVAAAETKPNQPNWWIATAVGLVLIATGWVAATHFSSHAPVATRSIRFQLHPPAGGRLDRTGIAVSPDGRMIAFVANAPGKRGIWIRAVDGIEPRLLPGTSGATAPFWSPDSRSIAFYSLSKLWRIDLVGGSPQAICDTSLSRRGTWSEDGYILFSEILGGLRRVSATGGPSVPFTALDAARQEVSHSSPQVLPGGRFIYVVRSGNRENTGIYAATLSKPQERVKLIAADVRSVEFATGHLLWRRGDTLVAQAFDPVSMKLSGEPRQVAQPVGGSNRLGDVPFSASASGLLFYFGTISNSQFTWFDRAGKVLGFVDEPGSYGSFGLSSDGKRLLTAREDDLWMADLDRKLWSRFTFASSGAVYPIWSPDGRVAIFKAGSSRNLYNSVAFPRRVEVIGATVILVRNGIDASLVRMTTGRLLSG